MEGEVDLLGEIKRGPRGGDLNRPNSRPEHRQASHTGAKTVDGLLMLHAIEYQDTATGGIKVEQAWHRMAAYMFANGCTNEQVARAADKASDTISTLKAQRWFQELLAHITTELGDDITRGFKSEAQASLAKLVKLRDDAESESVQLSAARTIIEQAVGKPIQKVYSVQENSSRYNSMRDEAKDLKAQLAAIRRSRQESPVIDLPEADHLVSSPPSVTEPSAPPASAAYPSDTETKPALPV